MGLKRYLITSADERTWKFDRPVVFLGDWCLRYDRKHIWSKMDMVVAQPYGIKLEERKADYATVCELRERIFPKICNLLNEVHDTNYSQRFWRILIGDWLIRCVDTLFNRIKTLEQCLDSFEISGSTVISNEYYALSTLDSLSAAYAFNDDYWDCILYSKVISSIASMNFPISVIVETSPQRFQMHQGTGNLSWRGIVKQFLYRINELTARLIGREGDAFIINSYLPIIIECKLQLSLGQIPQVWGLGHAQTLSLLVDANLSLRKKLGNNFLGGNKDNLEKVIESLIFELMPVPYLEGFSALSDTVDKLPWPKNPKFIFTSNNFDFDDIFKCYAAKKSCLSGIPYYIGCHGSGYFSYFDNPSNSEVVPDKHITWGWEHGLPQHKPAFIFKTVGKKQKQYNKNGMLLLIELPLFNRLTTWDVYADHKKYFDNQTKFVGLLDAQPKDKLLIRLHPSTRTRGWFESERWAEFDPAIKLEGGSVNVSELIAQSRLVVHGYDSTGLAETLSLNVPTLAILQVGFGQLNEFSKPYYQILVDAGIVHLTPDSASAKVNEIWCDIEGWWNQSFIQDARKKFCDKYARFSDNPVRDLKKILSSEMQ